MGEILHFRRHLDPQKYVTPIDVRVVGEAAETTHELANYFHLHPDEVAMYGLLLMKIMKDTEQSGGTMLVREPVQGRFLTRNVTERISINSALRKQ